MEPIQDLTIPVIAIDGWSCTGKGTARAKVAEVTGFHELDSGVYYRALGVQADRRGCLYNTEAITLLAEKLDLKFVGDKILLDNVEETKVIRSDEAGKAAAVVAKISLVREIFRSHQLAMRKMPGLVADGRDMGDIYNTPHRFFIETSPEARAERRVIQFKLMGIEKSYEDILADIIRRDESDRTNPANPLRPHPNAMRINNTFMKANEVRDLILETCKLNGLKI